MAILSTDIHFRGTVKTGTAGNSVAYGGAGTSLGGFTASGDIGTTTLFPDVTGTQNSTGLVDYAAVDVYNANGTLTLQNAKFWLTADVSGGATLALGLDPAGPTAVTGTGTTQGTSIANSTTAPAGVTFTNYTTGTYDSYTNGLALNGTTGIPAGQMKRVWVRRTVTANTPAINADGATFNVQGDTAP